MATYRCKQKCFYRNRLWAEDEILSPMPGEVLPKHFELVDAKAKAPTKEENKKIKDALYRNDENDPKTFGEFHQRRNDAMQIVIEERENLTPKPPGYLDEDQDPNSFKNLQAARTEGSDKLLAKEVTPVVHKKGKQANESN